MSGTGVPGGNQPNRMLNFGAVIQRCVHWYSPPRLPTTDASVRVRMAMSPRVLCQPDPIIPRFLHGPGNLGLIKLVVDSRRGLRVGATSAGPSGGEVLSMLACPGGLEIDVHRLRGRPLRLALTSFVASFAVAIALAVGFGLAAGGYNGHHCWARSCCAQHRWAWSYRCSKTPDRSTETPIS